MFVGLGGILVCSFLGGMRAVTWTQVAQYVILIIAYLIPVVWLSMKVTNFPIPQLSYGYALQKVTEREKAITVDPKEIEVRGILKAKADAASEKLKDVNAAYAADKATAEKKVADLKKDKKAKPEDVAAAEKAQPAWAALPVSNLFVMNLDGTGLVNILLGYIGIKPIYFLSTGDLATFSVILVKIWRSFPFMIRR